MAVYTELAGGLSFATGTAELTIFAPALKSLQLCCNVLVNEMEKK